MFFLRDTRSPEVDLERGFSCNVNAWMNSEEEAMAYQERHGGLTHPRYDEKIGRWCADPELGLSSFAFHDEASFNQAMAQMESYALENIAVFISDEYDLNAGLDGEDVFRGGSFLKYIQLDSSFADVLQ